MQNALIACAVLGLVAGLLAPLIVSRGMSFAVHGTSELAFTGAAGRAAAGDPASGSARWSGAVVAGLVFGLLGLRQRERDSVIGVVLAFGLGMGVLMLSLYDGRASNKFGLLTGSIVSVDWTNLWCWRTVAVVALGRAGRRVTGRCCSPAPTRTSRWPAGCRCARCRWCSRC